MPTTLTPQAFVAKWQDTTLKERAADGWPADLTNEEILAQLLALNLERLEK